MPVTPPLKQQPKRSTPKKWHKSVSALGVAIAVHILLFLILAVIVILPVARPTPEIQVQMAPVAEEQKREKLEVQHQTQVRQPKATSNLIQAQAMANLSIAKPEISDAPVGLGEVALGQSAFAGQLEQVGGKSLFGTPVQAKKLGVIIDGSGSMKPFIQAVVDEVVKNFKDAEIVIAGGCSLKSQTTIVVPSDKVVGEGYIARVAYTALEQAGVPFSVIGEPEKNKFATRQANMEPALRFLSRDKGCDAIYWFADFTDTLEDSVVRKAKSALTSRNTKLYLHDVDAQQVDAIPEVLREIVKTTGGDFIVGPAK